jgi:protein involved in polysaccharide export with SLBB domain
MLNISGLFTSLIAVFLLNACSSSTQMSINTDTAGSVEQANAEGEASGRVTGTNSHELEELWAFRTQKESSGDFAIGPGDVLEISVPAIEELRNREERVLADNTIELPMIGTLNVGGMGERAVRDQLQNRLRTYTKDPQVDVFVKEYQSREVAVAGMVQKPGLYTLNKRSVTILDMIGRAGGMKENASTRVIFIPVSSPGGGSPRLGELSAANEDSGGFAENKTNEPPGYGGPVKQVSTASAASVAASGVPHPQSNQTFTQYISGHKGTNDIVIDVSSINRDTHLDFPLWPGDAIIVPAAGEVMVRGWVKNPGAFNITPAMTVLGAITAAGGELFSSSAEVLRTGANGDAIQMSINLAKVEKGAERDVLVQAGDVVVVNRSAVGAVPYLAYTLFNKFSTAAYLPIY